VCEMPTGNMVMFSILMQILKELLCILTFYGHQTLEFCLLCDDQELIRRLQKLLLPRMVMNLTPIKCCICGCNIFRWCAF
jgi:hypothetical protein